MKLYLLENCIFYDFGCSGMSGTLTNMFVHNYKLPHHQFFPLPSMYTPIPATVTRWVPNPSPTPIRPQPKPLPTLTNTRDPMQTNRRPKEPNVRQTKPMKPMTMTTTWISPKMNKKQRMGWRTRTRTAWTTPQHWEAVNEGVQWKKAPLEGTSGTIDNDRALISLFFSFFNYLWLFFRKSAHDWAHDDREQSPPRYAGHDRNDCALLSFFFSVFQLLTRFLQENRVWSGSQRQGTVPTKVRRAWSLWSCPSFFL